MRKSLLNAAIKFAPSDRMKAALRRSRPKPEAPVDPGLPTARAQEARRSSENVAGRSGSPARPAGEPSGPMLSGAGLPYPALRERIVREAAGWTTEEALAAVDDFFKRPPTQDPQAAIGLVGALATVRADEAPLLLGRFSERFRDFPIGYVPARFGRSFERLQEFRARVLIDVVSECTDLDDDRKAALYGLAEVPGLVNIATLNETAWAGNYPDAPDEASQDDRDLGVKRFVARFIGLHMNALSAAALNDMHALLDRVDESLDLDEAGFGLDVDIEVDHDGQRLLRDTIRDALDMPPDLVALDAGMARRLQNIGVAMAPEEAATWAFDPADDVSS